MIYDCIKKIYMCEKTHRNGAYMNFYSNKTRKIITTVIAVIAIIAMVLPTLAYFIN